MLATRVLTKGKGHLEMDAVCKVPSIIFVAVICMNIFQKSVGKMECVFYINPAVLLCSCGRNISCSDCHLAYVPQTAV
jgi:hypothetical protein